jgi:hypothetical protein
MAFFTIAGFPSSEGALKAAQFKNAKKFALEVGAEMSRQATEEVLQRFEIQPFERRRHPGTRRLSAKGTISFNRDEIKATKQYPINVDFRILGGEDVVTRALVLNNGAQTHEIESTDINADGKRWVLKGVGNPNRFTGRDQISDIAGFGKIAYPIGGLKYNVVNGSVLWTPGPAQSKTGFLQAARDRAIQMVRAEFR